MTTIAAIALALAGITTGIGIGVRLTERRHQADLIQQAAAIRGEMIFHQIRRSK